MAYRYSQKTILPPQLGNGPLQTWKIFLILQHLYSPSLDMLKAQKKRLLFLMHRSLGGICFWLEGQLLVGNIFER